MSRRRPKRRNPAGGRGPRKAQSGGLQVNSTLVEAVIAMDGGLKPGGSRLVAVQMGNGRLGDTFIYAFRTVDGSETHGIGPLPMPVLAALAPVAEPVDADMAKNMRNMLAAWRAEQAGMSGGVH